jgi:hypothetical protein
MIGFGITIGKAGDVLKSEGIYLDSSEGLQFMGLLFVALAVLGLAGALIQNMRIANRLAKQGYGRVEPVPLGEAMGILVLVFGIAGGIFIFA